MVSPGGLGFRSDKRIRSVCLHGTGDQRMINGDSDKLAQSSANRALAEKLTSFLSMAHVQPQSPRFHSLGLMGSGVRGSHPKP